MVEVLVCIVLIGLAVTSLLVTLSTSIKASAINRDHVNAHAWLQTASDVLYATPRVDCGSQAASQEPAVEAAYSDAVKATSNPEGWGPNQISIVGPVLFWDGKSQYQSTCYDDQGVNLQLIEIQVTAPTGHIIESVQVVKG